jgi:hypothetical protein
MPQFRPTIPRYKEEISHRLGVVVEQFVEETAMDKGTLKQGRVVKANV